MLKQKQIWIFVLLFFCQHDKSLANCPEHRHRSLYPASHSVVACDSETAHLNCENGHIQVLSANYGRTDSKTCSSGRLASQISNVQCTQSSSRCVVATQCDGKKTCSVPAVYTIFGDPCYGTFKYLHVSYTCIKTKSLVACDSETANLSCKNGHIKVLSANYGRTDSHTCSTGRPANQLSNVQCRSEISSKCVLTTRCNGKQTCSVPAVYTIFGDPCIGTYKYLTVSYTCGPI
ncbi:L-rhamnose-binding lectin CSL2-like [Paramisgurnus dabryanus]|uniref:L-rhamnose-binding lectin CSL2-like n=1 Tax=Paramisgurnus dabryanus TaxID=90735 RepID=UPI0031F3608C